MKLSDFKELVEAASPGPWHNQGYNDDTVYDVNDSTVAKCELDGDQKFIAACRTMVPKLLAVAEAAGNEALYWNEEYCTGADYQKLMDARMTLQDARVALEADHD